jgi:acyl carrier protein
VQNAQAGINHAPITEKVRRVLDQHGRLAAGAAGLADDSDLYEAGLTSLTTVNLMLALEDQFNVEFPDALLKRKTFSSIRSLSEAVESLLEA